MARRDPQSGVVLINVLVTLALALAVLHAMISVADLSITRGTRYSEASQAQALISAGEASLVSALLQDMDEAPLSDNLTERWARIAQDPVAISRGTFALGVEDAQSRINLNSDAVRGVRGGLTLRRIGEALRLPDATIARIRARVARPVPLSNLGELAAAANLTPTELSALGRYLTVLPRPTDVNLNTASDEVIRVLADNRAQALALIDLRNSNATLTSADFNRAQVIPPQGVAFTSSWFRATITVRIGSTTQRTRSLIQRGSDAEGQRYVNVVARETPIADDVAVRGAPSRRQAVVLPTP